MVNTRRKNLIKYVLPTILSNVCFFLFTIIDGIFVGRGVGTDALGAVNMIFPYIMLLDALYALSTIGGVSVFAIRIGRGDKNSANEAFMHSLSATLFIAVIMCCAGFFTTSWITNILGANDTFREMMYDYLHYYSAFIIPAATVTSLMAFIRNDGSPLRVSVAVIISTICNIFADWYFIFPLHMGLKGAALATGISQSLMLIILLPHLFKKKGDLRLTAFKPKREMYSKIILRGLPEAIAQLSSPVSIFCMNYVLLSMVGDIGVNAFSIISYVASFSVAIFYGTARGLQPLIGRSYGAKNVCDLKYYFHAGLLINFIGSVMITILMYFVAAPICSMFTTDHATLDFTVRCLPQYSWGFIIMSFNSIINAYLYSTKRSKQAIIINILRSFIVNSSVTILLPFILGSGIVWFTFGIYEAVVLTVSLFLLKSSEKNGIVFI